MIVEVGENELPAAAIHAASWKESHRAFCKADFIERHTLGQNTGRQNAASFVLRCRVLFSSRSLANA